MMLLIIRLHTSPDLLHNFCSIIHALRLKVVTFCILFISDDDDLVCGD